MATESRDQAATVRSTSGTAPPRRRTLLVMAGDEITTRPLPLTGELTVGRGSAADVQLDHPSISRAHLRLSLTQDALRVTDLDSANGTTLRGVRIPPGAAVQVSANEAIGAGDLTLVVQEIRPVDGAAAPGAAPRPSGAVARGDVDPLVLDPVMRRLYDLAARVAQGTIGVLLVGETGTGKEVLAEHVHRSSPRAGGPLVRVNCAALTDSLVESELFGHEKGAFTGAQRDRRGLLEAADGGTAFLDEIGEVPPSVQAKLLRVLEEGTVLRVGASSPRQIDVRFVAATNRDLEAEVAAGRFRRDLYFRLAGAVLAIPPLRERPGEIEPLARRFAADAAQRLGRPPARVTDAAITRLRAHPWTGNVRELRNVIERAVLVADGAIDVEHLAFGTAGAPVTAAPAPAIPSEEPAPAPPSAAAPASDTPLGEQLAELERQRILDALERCGGNQTRAAELLGMPRRTLVKRLAAYGVPRPRKR